METISFLDSSLFMIILYNICNCYQLIFYYKNGCCCFSVAQLCPTLYNPMDCRMPGFLVLHYLSEFAQTHVHWVSDAIQPPRPSSSPSPPAFNLSQHQGLFKWVSFSYQVAKYWSFSIQDWFPLGLTGLISLQPKGLSRVFSSTTVKKHHFFSTQPSLWSNIHIHSWLLEKPLLWPDRPLSVNIGGKYYSNIFLMLSSDFTTLISQKPQVWPATLPNRVDSIWDILSPELLYKAWNLSSRENFQLHHRSSITEQTELSYGSYRIQIWQRF